LLDEENTNSEILAWIKVAKGDVAGHEFHGNQWQIIGFSGQLVDKPNRFIKSNRYAGKCAICGQAVGVGQGGTSKSRDGKWNTFCQNCCEQNGPIVPTPHGSECSFCQNDVSLEANNAGKTYVANVGVPTPHGPLCLSKTKEMLDYVKSDKASNLPPLGTPERQAIIDSRQSKYDRALQEYAYFAKPN
jgi:hypothetical protein